jgi:hypothetical protein
MQVGRKLAATVALGLVLSGLLAAPASARRDRTGDADRDHVADSWELASGLDRTDRSDRKADFDGDKLRDEKEFRFGSDPLDEDSDDDGIDHGDEQQRAHRLQGPDANGNGVLDGDDDRGHGGVANEDEDDRRERCGAWEDDDRDGDGLADEDEDGVPEDRCSPGGEDDDDNGGGAARLVPDWLSQARTPTGSPSRARPGCGGPTRSPRGGRSRGPARHRRRRASSGWPSPRWRRG